MATQFGAYLKGLRNRVTRLGLDGAPVVGTCSSVVTEGFTQVTWGLELEAGAEYLQKNAQGGFCINQKDSPQAKWTNLGIQWCQVHPDILDMVANAIPVVNGADTIGTRYDESKVTDAFALEVWSEKAGSTTSWLYTVVPYVKNGVLDGDQTIEDAPINMTTTGEGFAQLSGAPWGEGPYGDNPYLVAGGVPAGTLIAQVETTVAPPAVSGGCVAIT